MTTTPTRWQRARRWAYNAAAVVSLLLALAVAGLWARSVWWASDVLRWSSAETVLNLLSWRGTVVFHTHPNRDSDLTGIKHFSMSPNQTRWIPVIDRVVDHISAAQTSDTYIVTDWLLILIFFALPAGWLVKRLRRRSGVGLCAQCGYDLRGTAPDRACPECGATRAAVSIAIDAKAAR